MRTRVCLCLALGLCAALVEAADSDWNLVWEDGFERAELGDQWFVRQPGAKVEIVDGRLHMGAGAPVVMVNRPFAPDIMIEFEAEADPDNPPCDISVAMAGSNIKGYVHLLAFGGRSNQANQIIGGGAHQVDHHPAFLIEHGKTYHLRAVKEGPWLRYFVDGQKILETRVADPLGGPGFDRVGLVTWNGMYVDNVKVYERKTPAPDGPVLIESMPDTGFVFDDRILRWTREKPLGHALDRGVELYNNRQYDAAVNMLSRIPPTLESVAALSYVLGDLAYEVTPEQQAQLVRMCEELAGDHPDHEGVQTFLRAARWFEKVRIFPRNLNACVRLLQPGPENNPFYYKARLFQARFHHASAIEGGDRTRVQEARDMFAELKKIWPEHEGLRGFTGESIPWGDELIRDESAGPAWARGLQETFARQQAILHWWFTERQMEDGQLGGGWGDDVELLRTWVSAACVSSACEPAIAGIERLADGIWTHECTDGYSRGIGDVEHSAEPSADSFPTMILLRYGDPLWVERNLASAKMIYEKFMGHNERGFLQFKSVEFGAEGVSDYPRHAGDTGYHARAMKHFIWLAWYGIPEARDVFSQWCDTWHDATMRQIDTKIAGFAPPQIWYPTGSILPPSGRTWYDPMSNYYGFPGLPQMVHDSFLTAHFLTGDRKYLVPVEKMMELSSLGPLHKGNPDEPPGSVENQLAALAHQSGNDITSVYRWLTGQRVYDEYTLRNASGTQRYWIDYDLEKYLGRFERMAQGMRTNWAMRTSEVLQTDRAGMQGAVELCGAYTGAVASFRDSRAPTHSVTYDSPDLNFASVVTETAPERLRVMMYSFRDEPVRIGLRPWRLVPGVYVLTAGEPVPGEKPEQNRYTWGEPRQIRHLHRGTPVFVEVPPGKEWVVDLRLVERIERPEVLPDLAIAPRDVRIEGNDLIVTVHNIGEAQAGAFDILLQKRDGDAWKTMSQLRVGWFPGIDGFNPARQDFSLQITEGETGPLRVVIDPDDRVQEIYELNNEVVVTR